MSLEEACSRQVRCVTRPRLGATRSSLEVQVGSLVYSFEQTSPFVKPPDPPGTREQGAALSEKRVRLRSVPQQAGMLSGSITLRHGDALPCSPWHSYATREVTDGSQRCEASELANHDITRCTRHALMHKPLSARSLATARSSFPRYPLFPCTYHPLGSLNTGGLANEISRCEAWADAEYFNPFQPMARRGPFMGRSNSRAVSLPGC
jgi:hypothetical protein